MAILVKLFREDIVAQYIPYIKIIFKTYTSYSLNTDYLAVLPTAPVSKAMRCTLLTEHRGNLLQQHIWRDPIQHIQTLPEVGFSHPGGSMAS